MDEILAIIAHTQLSSQVMDDKIWELAAPDITGHQSHLLRRMIPMITTCYRSRASLAVSDYIQEMWHRYGYSRPTLRKQLLRLVDLKYALLKDDPKDGRVIRIHATRKAIKACKRVAELTLLKFDELANSLGYGPWRINLRTRNEFAEKVRYDAVATIDQAIIKKRGRRSAAI